MTDLDLAAIQARADAATPGPWTLGIVYGTVMRSSGGNIARDSTEANAEFIAHARTDVPALLARIAELEAGRDELFDGRVLARRERNLAERDLDAVKESTDG